MQIIGADLGTRSVTMCLLTDGKRFAYQKIVAPQGVSSADIAWTVFTGVRSFTAGLPAQSTAAFIEEPVVAGARNIRVSLKIAQVCGAVLTALWPIRQVYQVPVSTWKANTCGHGGATKDQVRSWLAETFPQAATDAGGDQDCYDAAAVAVHGARCLDVVPDLRRHLLASS